VGVVQTTLFESNCLHKEKPTHLSGFFGGDNKSDDFVIVFFLPSGSLTKRTASQSAFLSSQRHLCKHPCRFENKKT
jgi:hypothetical protein